MESINHQQAQEFLHMRPGDLSEADRLALQAHLASCPDCRAYAASLEMLQGKLRPAFHSRWDGIQPVKSCTGGLLIRLGREIRRNRITTFAGTLVGVSALFTLVLSLNFMISSLRPAPVIASIVPTHTSTRQPIIPLPTGGFTPTNTLVPSATPLPEGTIVLNWGLSILPDPITKTKGDSWAQGLSAASGMNVVALPGPTSNMEILEALRDGRIHMAEIDALPFSYGLAQGWILPGPVLKYTYQPDGRAMFVARNDTGLVAGETEQMYQQLAGKRPCWPNLESMNWPPVYEYIIPAGLLAQNGVELGLPVFIGHPKLEGMVQAKAVFLQECDFAVFESEPVEGFMSLWFPDLGSKGFTFNDWTNDMQVLYYTPPLVPFRIMAFSSQLDDTERELLTDALLTVPTVQGDNGTLGWLPYDDNQIAFYDQFKALVDASGVDVADYLSRVWDQYLQGVISAAQAPSRSPTPTAPTSARTLTICQGAEPDTLYINNSNMLAAKNIFEAIYDGPIDSTGFSYQPVILEKLPSLADGDASIQPVAVKENDFVVNDAGEVVQLKNGEVVRPYGCNLSDCAITWQGEALEMAQMSASFTLKDDIRWSDGEPLTAHDSVFGFEIATGCRSADNPTAACGAVGAGRQQTVERTYSYTALDDRTTQWVGLPGYFDQTYMTNFAHPLPRHQLQGMTPGEFFTSEESAMLPMGWGPYIIDEWQHGEYIRFTRNLYYFRANEGLPYFDQLIIRFFGLDEEATLSALQSGGCDLIDYEQASTNTSLERLIEADNSGQIKALITTSTMWEHLDFNIQPAGSILNSGLFAGWDQDGDGQGPFGDVRLRQAIAMCLDRQKVVDTLFFGKSPVPDTYLPPNHPQFNSQATHWSYDPSAAAALLDDIGWQDSDNDPATPRLALGVTGVPDGTPLTMNYETTTAEVRQQVFQILVQSLSGCGIQVNLRTYSSMEFLNDNPAGRVFGRRYDLAEFSWLTGFTPPCDLFLSNQLPSDENKRSGQNNSGFTDPAYDAACNLQIQSLPGDETFIQAALEAQRIFAEQLPVVPLFLRLKTAAARPDMCGYSLDPTSQSDFWNIEAFNYGEGCE